MQNPFTIYNFPKNYYIFENKIKLNCIKSFYWMHDCTKYARPIQRTIEHWALDEIFIICLFVFQKHFPFQLMLHHNIDANIRMFVVQTNDDHKFHHIDTMHLAHIWIGEDFSNWICMWLCYSRHSCQSFNFLAKHLYME